MTARRIRTRHVVRDRDGVVAACEESVVSVRADGGVGLASVVAMGPAAIDRQVLYELDAGGRPRSAAVMLHQAAGFSSAWFDIDGATLSTELRCVRQGRLAQRLTWPAPIAAFGTHALINDGWFVRLHDPAGAAAQRFTVPVSSVSPNGDSGLMAELVALGVERLGEGEVAVPAGRFAVERFALGFGPLSPFEVAVRREDQLLVHLDWAEAGVTAVLERLDEGED